MKKLIAALAIASALAASSMAALAHHGWTWTTGGNIDLTGIIKSAKLGNPHGVLKVDVDGEVWTIEVGQPWRNERAGLKDGDLASGVEVRIIGQPSSDTSNKLMKAEKVYLKGKLYNLYPNRD